MSRGKQLQEMDPGTKQSKTAVNANAKPADSMDTSVAGTYEDLGGPTPDNYKPDDDSAKLKTPGGTLKQVSDVVTNRKGKTAKEDVEVEGEDTLTTLTNYVNAMDDQIDKSSVIQIFRSLYVEAQEV